MQYSASCRCGKIKVTLVISQPIENFQPRQCDCDFCRSHNLIFISEPEGHLSLVAQTDVIQLKQGSEQAKFWQCTSCQQIVAVSCEIAGNLKGTVNANLFAQSHKLKTPVVVSPKLLSLEQKRDRWAKAWLSFSPEQNV